MTLLETFAANVRKHRLKQGLSQEKLAELTGLHRTYISDIERVKRSISIKNIEEIALALQIDAYILLIPNDSNS